MDWLTEVSSCRRVAPAIEADAWDDEAGHGYDPLDRWGDRRFAPVRDRFAEWQALVSRI